MPRGKSLKLKGKKLIGRLTGISTAFVGASWKPPVDESEETSDTRKFKL
jgi:hypothetical protein